jgi:hypothetical protein
VAVCGVDVAEVVGLADDDDAVDDDESGEVHAENIEVTPRSII